MVLMAAPVATLSAAIFTFATWRLRRLIGDKKRRLNKLLIASYFLVNTQEALAAPLIRIPC
jgi:hypothetical protein